MPTVRLAKGMALVHSQGRNLFLFLGDMETFQYEKRGVFGNRRENQWDKYLWFRELYR
jgi:hypothetical protein